MADSAAISQHLSTVMSRFLAVELEVGFMFAQAATESRETRTLLHNRMIARKAYDMAGKMMNRAHITKMELRMLRTRREKLRSVLCGLGDPCWLPSAGSEPPEQPVHRTS
jgi:hypothetical protein